MMPSRREQFIRTVINPIYRGVGKRVGFERLKKPFKWLTEKLANDDMGPEENRIEELRKEDLSPSVKQLARIMSVADSWNTESIDYTQVNRPVLCLYGEHEPEWQVAGHRTRWRRDVDFFQIETIPDAGHNSHVDNPEYFARAVEKSINRHLDQEEPAEQSA